MLLNKCQMISRDTTLSDNMWIYSTSHTPFSSHILINIHSPHAMYITSDNFVEDFLEDIFTNINETPVTMKKNMNSWSSNKSPHR